MPMYGRFGDPHARRRRLMLWRLVSFALAWLLAAGSAAYGYQVGASAKQARLDALETEVDELQTRTVDLSDRLARVSEERRRARAALADLRERYAEDVPQGRAAVLLDRVRRQIELGVEPERLALFIDAAGRRAPCDDDPETKRFMPRTPISEGPVSAVRFDERIIVTGRGASARSEQGLNEAWFDPAEPVALDFRTLDGEVLTIEGRLPLHHRMIVDESEYRFAIVEGERSFVEVTVQACEAPLPDLAGPPADPA